LASEGGSGTSNTKTPQGNITILLHAFGFKGLVGQDISFRFTVSMTCISMLLTLDEGSVECTLCKAQLVRPHSTMNIGPGKLSFRLYVARGFEAMQWLRLVPMLWIRALVD
jgi:hypothetical protein